MLIKRKGRTLVIALFIALEAVFFFLIQFSGGVALRAFEFSSVVCALGFSLTFVSSASEDISTAVGLLFTVISDLFLVVIEPQYKLVAMIFFSLAQLSYFSRLLTAEGDKKRRRAHLFIRKCVSLGVIILTIIVLKDKADALSLVSMFYYANLALNIVYSVIYSRQSLLFPIGLTFFILCDTVVGLSVMDGMYFDFGENSFVYKLIHADINLVWLFYVPSQTLIALSIPERQSRGASSNKWNK